MKKILALLLTLVFVLALSACDNNDRNPNRQNQNNTSVVQSNNDKAESGTQADVTNPNTSSTQLITRDRAIELALSHAGLLHRSDIYDLDAELDRERGGVYWEVDFESGNLEYSYDINAETEEVIKLEKERD